MPRVGGFLRRSRHGTVFYFRRRVPRDLALDMGCSAVCLSLHTSDHRVALIRARKIATAFDAAVAEFRMNKGTGKRGNWGAVYQFTQDETTGKLRVLIQTEPHDSTEERDRVHELAKRLAEGQLVPERSTGLATETRKPDATPTLGEAVNSFLAVAQLKATTLNAYRTALRNVALPFFGADVRIGAIKQSEFARFVEHLNKDASRSRGTKEGYLVAFTSMFKHYRVRGVPVETLHVGNLLAKARVTAQESEREAFSLVELSAIFANAARYRHSEPHKFWVTVGVAFLGCRLEELAQVNLDTDLNRDPSCGSWFLRLDEIPDESGDDRKSIKRRASVRSVPIHSALVGAGFLEYLLQRKETADKRPFSSAWKPLVRAGHTKWSHYISRWGGVELTRLRASGQIAGKKTYFHSMRHTFAMTLAEQDVSPELRNALQGHTTGGVNSERYAKLKSNIVKLTETVERHLGAYVSALDNALAATPSKLD